VKSVVIKLFAKKKDATFEAEPRYIFRPSPDAQGNYQIKLDYANQTVFVQGDYRVEYVLASNTNSIKSGSYLAKLTNDCEPIITLPDGTTVRTGGGELFTYFSLIFALTIAGYSWFRLKRKEVEAKDFFERE
jgi:hypothetical protein